jgi:DNA-binding response OmpR family regulator
MKRETESRVTLHGIQGGTNMEETIRILLVDDERPVQRSMEKTLLRAGFEVDIASNITQGLALFHAVRQGEHPFDIAILDLNMPNFEGIIAPDAGLDLLKTLMEAQPTLPVIVLTAFDEVAKTKAAINAGARDYFVKGREEGLVELVNKTLAGGY